MADNILTLTGLTAVTQTSKPILYTLDDDANNLVSSGYALLRMEGLETADIKVMWAYDDSIETITGVDANYINYALNALVKKVYATGTTFTASNIKLYI